MKKSLLLFFLPIFSLSISHAQIENGSFEFEGTIRDYIVFLPQNFQPNMPVVFHLHGGGAAYGAEWHMNYTLMNDVADTSGFIVVYPYSKIPYWNVNIFDPDEPDVDDVGFISILIDTIRAKYNIDINRIYCCGGFLGSAMTQHLLCTIGYRFAAGAGVAAPMGEYTAANYKPIRPFPIMMCYGTIPWDGSRPGFMAPEDNLEFWVQNNKCVSSPDTIELPDVNLADSSYIEKISYTNCKDETMILFYKVINGGLSWPGACCDISWGYPTNRDINASVEIWNFVKNFENPLADIAYTKSFEISPRYMQSDTLYVNAYLSNPENHQLEVYSIIKADGSEYQDSIKLFDDGLHNDGNVSDNLYSGYKWLSNLEEDFYNVELFTYDIDMGKTPKFYLKEHFTTAGPLKVDSVSYTKNTSRHYYSLKPYVRNVGNSLTVKNAKIYLYCNDPWVDNVTTGISLPDISPGATVSNNSLTTTFFYIDSLLPSPVYFNLALEITANEVLYWTDSLSIGEMSTGIKYESLLPIIYKLEQSYPNPFNPTTTIKYQVPELSSVTLKVYDVLGREITKLVDMEKPVGNYEVEFNATSLPSGIYFYRLQAGSFIETKKMILMK